MGSSSGSGPILINSTSLTSPSIIYKNGDLVCWDFVSLQGIYVDPNCSAKQFTDIVLELAKRANERDYYRDVSQGIYKG